MNFGNGLENIRKQMLMQDLINQLNKMWIYDTMTGVLNRAGFYSKAGDLVDRCREQKEKLLLLFIDADKLKAVNDTYGHEEGDFYIKAIAKVCQQSVNNKTLVMRYGGDEFVILKKYSNTDSPLDYINRIKDAIYQVRENENKPYIMDVSIGYYISDVDDDFKLEIIVDQADKDMYAMKKVACRSKVEEAGEWSGKQGFRCINDYPSDG